MKKLNIIAIAMMGLLVLTGTQCNRALDQAPISSTSPENFWRDKSDARAWMGGIYNQLQTVLRTNYFDWGEVRSDNVQASGTGNAQVKLVNNLLAASDADLNGITRWTDLYTAISLCNYGIKYFPIMIQEDRDAGASVYRDYLGECYALRALLYFYGMRVWGELPIILKPVESLEDERAFPRSPIAALKTQIQADITASLGLIGSNTTDVKNMRYRMQKAAVYALQTDVHMWFQEYPEAIVASQNCITESKCSWVANAQEWKDIFVNPEASKETIFNLWWDYVERANQGIGVCQKVASASNTNQYMFRPDIWLQLRERGTDARGYMCWDTVLAPSAALYISQQPDYGKFHPFVTVPGGAHKVEGNNECNVKIPIYRYADIQLLRAEALTHVGRHLEALDIVNKVRSRVGYTVQAKLADYTGDITKGIERTILQERQFELMGEGKRWFDLCRIGKTYDFSNNGYEYLREMMNPILAGRNGAPLFENGANTPNGMGRILYPINSDVFNANPLLRGHQNQPYDE
ncbi:RagB/SusD family nutrient uptake outer membrane protein [Chitinophaga lutea]